MQIEIIPENNSGKSADIEYTQLCPTDRNAEQCYERARKRLLNPLIWHQLIGKLGADFVLTGEEGKDVNRLMQVKDHIKIRIPGPANGIGNGFDWVRVEALVDASTIDEETIAVTVRAAQAPESDAESVAHFLGEDATSTFKVYRIHNTVTASYHGRNELANIHTESITDNLRNGVVASAAMMGLSEVQWKALMKALLQDEIGG